MFSTGVGIQIALYHKLKVNVVFLSIRMEVEIVIQKGQFSHKQMTRLICAFPMAVNLAALIILAPMNTVHSGCALVLAVLIIVIMAAGHFNLNLVLLAGLITGIAGVVQHLLTGISLVLPLVLSLTALVCLVWINVSKYCLTQRRLKT